MGILLKLTCSFIIASLIGYLLGIIEVSDKKSKHIYSDKQKYKKINDKKEIILGLIFIVITVIIFNIF